MKLECTLPIALKPNGVAPLIRVGSVNDGGYVVARPAINDTRNVLGMGLGDNCDFEFQVNTMIDLRGLHIYDHTVTTASINKAFVKSVALFPFNNRKRRHKIRFARQYRNLFLSGLNDFRHFEQPIGSDKDAVTATAAINRLNDKNNLFLKIDIEGAEYEILGEVADHASHLNGLTMEFHDVHQRISEIVGFAEHMADTMRIDNVWVNNYGQVADNDLPCVIEISMSAKRYHEDGEIVAADDQRRSLNMPNFAKREAINIIYSGSN